MPNYMCMGVFLARMQAYHLYALSLEKARQECRKPYNWNYGTVFSHHEC